MLWDNGQRSLSQHHPQSWCTQSLFLVLFCLPAIKANKTYCSSFFFYNSIQSCCCSPYTPWFWVQVSARAHWDRRSNKSVNPVSPLPPQWTYRSTQHNTLCSGSPQKWAILTPSLVIKPQHCQFSLSKTLRELKKNQKQIPQGAPHLTAAHQISSPDSNQQSALIIFFLGLVKGKEN